MLAPLPLAALRLEAAIVSALDRVGLKRSARSSDAPRAPLAARFGSGLLRRLDQALGVDEEAISPRRPPPAFIAERRFAEPIAREEDIAATLASLAATLAVNLETHGEGARVLELALFRVDGVVTTHRRRRRPADPRTETCPRSLPGKIRRPRRGDRRRLRLRHGRASR